MKRTTIMVWRNSNGLLETNSTSGLARLLINLHNLLKLDHSNMHILFIISILISYIFIVPKIPGKELDRCWNLVTKIIVGMPITGIILMLLLPLFHNFKFSSIVYFILKKCFHVIEVSQIFTQEVTKEIRKL